MHSRAVIAGVALALVGITLGCGRKHQVSARMPRLPATAASPAPIHDGETGLASWYGRPYHGRAAANGEIYDMEKLTAAHRTLPFGTWVRVTNLNNNRSVEVRIIDRGPFVDGRIIDVSHAAAQEIELIGPGVAPVRLDIISTPQIAAPAEILFAVQAGAFQDKDRAERLRSSMEQEYGSARLVLRPGNPALWRVLVGRERSEDAANTLADRLRREIGTGFVVRLDDGGQSPRPIGGTEYE